MFIHLCIYVYNFGIYIRYRYMHQTSARGRAAPGPLGCRRQGTRQVKPSPLEMDGCVGSVVSVSSHKLATFRRKGGGYSCRRVARLFTSKGLLHLFSRLVLSGADVEAPDKSNPSSKSF